MARKVVVSRAILALSALVSLALGAGCGTKNNVYDAGLDAISEPPLLALTPGGANFPDTAPSQVAPPVTFKVINLGLQPTAGIVTVLEASADGVFKITNNECSIPLQSQETCNIVVQFSPKAPGDYSARLTVSTANSSMPAIAMITGSSAYSLLPSLVISPGVADFVRTSIDPSAVPPTQAFTVTNTGSLLTGPLTVNPPNEPSFAVAENACGTTLMPGAMCSISVRFKPSTSGPHVGVLEVEDKANSIKVTATLSGTGIKGAHITLNPPTTFPDTAVGLQVSRLFTLVNSGEEPTGTISIIPAGDEGDFTLDSGGCAKPLPGAQSGQTTSCSFKLTFAPKTVGTKNLSVQISASPGGDAAFDISANATLQPTTTITLMQIGGNPFLNVPLGQSRTALYLVQNTGNMMAGKPDATLAGNVGDEFMLVNNCASDLAPNDSCNIQITFTPKDVNPKNLTMLVTASPGGMQAVQIMSTAVNADIGNLQFSSNGFHDFGTHSVTQQTNTTFTFTITNNGQLQTGPITVGNIEGSTPGDFTIVGTDCPNRQLLTSQTCFIRIRFQPLPPRDLPMFGRTRSASLTLTADPGGKPVASFFGTASN